MRDGESPRALPHPVRCADCANGVRLLGRCRLAPLVPWPGVKELGCLYHRERRGARGKGERA